MPKAGPCRSRLPVAEGWGRSGSFEPHAASHAADPACRPELALRVSVAAHQAPRLLQVRNLRTCFDTDDGSYAAVDGVDFEVEAGRTLAIVGESGCGKSVTALSIMGLVAKPAGRIDPGSSVRFEGFELVGAPERALQDLRGNALAMIFQEPMSSLNPAYTIGEQIVEGLLRHRPLNRTQAAERAVEMLCRVRIPAPEQRFFDYPHQLSGGMRQRAMIAMALACEPRLLIADEPTTALDVTIQAQILDLMRSLQRDTGSAVILITHDLGVVAEVADEVLVMYAGRVVERAAVQALFDAPQHPYTVGLLGSMPLLTGQRDRLAAIDGQVPSPLRLPPGCRFAERCPFADDHCRAESPALIEVAPGHWSACWKAPLEPASLMAETQAVVTA